MIKYRLLLILCLVAGIAGAQQQPSQFTLKACIDFALMNNQKLLNAELDKDIASTQVRETLSMGLPQANINGGLNYNFEPQKSLIDISTFDPTAPEGTEQQVSFQQKYDGNVGLSVRQLLFDGSFFVGLQAAKTYKELSTKEHIKTQIDIVEAVTQAYYSALIFQARQELVETNFARLDSLLSDTQLMYENGFAEKIDVSRIQVQYNNLKVQRTSTLQMLDYTKDLLKFQMGYPIDSEIELTDNLEEVIMNVEDKEDDFNYSERIEYSQLQTNQALINLDMKNSRVQYIPTLYANLNYGFNTATSRSDQLFQTDRWLNYGALGVTLGIPVFDGFLKRSKIQKNKIQLQQVSNSMELLEQSIDLEISQSEMQLETALNNMVAQKQNMLLSQEIYNTTKIKYQEGVGSNLELVEADADYKEAQTNYYNALYEALIAQVSLEKAQGHLLKYYNQNQ